MKLLHLTLSSFMGWSKLDLDLSQHTGVTAILGVIDGDCSHSNGAGKSSVVMAILFSLYGKQVTKTMDELIMQGKEAEGFRVALTFEYEGHTYEVVRRKKGNTQQKVQFKNLTTGEILSGEPESLIKMPLAIWNNTVFSAQNKLAGFVDQSPSARKDTLTELFGMATYLEMEAAARTKNTSVAGSLSYALGERDRLKAELEGLSLPMGEPEVSKSAIGRSTEQMDILAVKLSGIQTDVAKCDATLSRAAEISTSVDELRSEYSRHSAKEVEISRDTAAKRARLTSASATERAKLDTPKPDLAAISEQHIKALDAREQCDMLRLAREDMTADTSRLTSAKSLKEYALARLQKKLDAFSSLGATCPTCGTTIDEDHKKSHSEQFTAEKITLESELISLDDSLKINCIKLHDIEVNIAKFKELADRIPSLEQQLLVAKNSEVDRLYSEKVIADVQAQLLELEQRHMRDLASLAEYKSAISDKITSLETELSSFDAIVHRRDTLLKDKESASKEYNSQLTIKEQLVHHLHKLEASQRDLLKVQGLLATASDNVKKWEEERTVYGELIKAFGPTGIPTLMLENCLADLQTYLDDYMSLMSDGRIKVTFKTTKTSASTGKVSETLAIMVSDINGERDIALYSGGEKVRIYLAIRLALAKLMARKSGNSVKMLLIDEIADLDDAGLSAFVQLLKSVDKEFSQIWLVSHLPELKNACSGALVLARDIHGNYVG